MHYAGVPIHALPAPLQLLNFSSLPCKCDSPASNGPVEWNIHCIWKVTLQHANAQQTGRLSIYMSAGPVTDGRITVTSCPYIAHIAIHRSPAMGRHALGTSIIIATCTLRELQTGSHLVIVCFWPAKHAKEKGGQHHRHNRKGSVVRAAASYCEMSWCQQLAESSECCSAPLHIPPHACCSLERCQRLLVETCYPACCCYC